MCPVQPVTHVSKPLILLNTVWQYRTFRERPSTSWVSSRCRVALSSPGGVRFYKRRIKRASPSHSRAIVDSGFYCKIPNTASAI